MALETPVAFIIFNRPDLTQKVFAAIAHAKPRKLLVIADGPRFPEEAEKCSQARAVIENVNWDCEVLTNFSDVNLGCKLRVSSGLDWVFSEVEEAIVLEDDCLPDPSFFFYCSELLDKYRNAEEVMMISGCNFQDGNSRTAQSYFFSRYAHVWGWASWRRAWKHYDVEVASWSGLPQTEWLRNLVDDEASVHYWANIFDSVSRGEIDTWDFQWLFACWNSDGLSIQPNKNLITNIGFGVGATHTTSSSPYANLPAFEIELPLQHPVSIERNIIADRYTAQEVFGRAAPEPKKTPLGRLRRIARVVFNHTVNRLPSSLHSSQVPK